MVLSNIREDTFAHRAFYIALSRIHRLDDLMLFAIETSPIGGPRIHVNQCHPRCNGPMGRGRWGSPNSHYLDLLPRSFWSCCYYTPDLWHPQALMTVVLLNYFNYHSLLRVQQLSTWTKGTLSERLSSIFVDLDDHMLFGIAPSLIASPIIHVNQLTSNRWVHGNIRLSQES